MPVGSPPPTPSPPPGPGPVSRRNIGQEDTNTSYAGASAAAGPSGAESAAATIPHTHTGSTTSSTTAAADANVSRPATNSRTIKVRPARCHSVDCIRARPAILTAAQPPATQPPELSHLSGEYHPHHLPPIQERSTLAVDQLLKSSDIAAGAPLPNMSSAPSSRKSSANTAPEIPPDARPTPPGTPPVVASGTKGRNRSHSVGVRMRPRNSLVTPRRQPNYQPDIEAQIPENEPRDRGSRSSDRERRSSVSAVNITIPEAHDSAIADHSGSLHDDVVGLLDCVDPEVGTVNHLQNVTNSIMFPHWPLLWDRRPNLTLNSQTDEYMVLPELTREPEELEHVQQGHVQQGRSRAGTLTRYIPGLKEKGKQPQRPPLAKQMTAPADIPLMPVASDDKQQMGHEVTEEEDIKEVSKEHELDRHVRRVLVDKQKVRRALRGLWAYLKTPMGIVTAIYGFLVAFWGAAIVLFLLGWIPTSSKDTQDKWVEISSQVTNGLFTVTGVGLIPWRVIDTYRMSVIWTLRMRVKRRRHALGLPPAKNDDDLPTEYDPDMELLTQKEVDKLVHNQDKFAESQTWYRPHETSTHLAFPVKWALWNTILMDGNSFFQCILCGCMWGMNRHTRPPWTTGSLIPLSFLCGIGAAVLIWQGGARTKKTKAVEENLRAALGVEEKVPEAVKVPRRATVTGVTNVRHRSASNPGPTPAPAFSADTVSSIGHTPSLESLPAVPPVGTLSHTFHKDMLELVDEAAEHLMDEPDEKDHAPDLSRNEIADGVVVDMAALNAVAPPSDPVIPGSSESDSDEPPQEPEAERESLVPRDRDGPSV